MALVDAAAPYLAGPGRRIARQALLRRGLPEGLVDDVLAETLVAVARVDLAARAALAGSSGGRGPVPADVPADTDGISPGDPGVSAGRSDGEVGPARDQHGHLIDDVPQFVARLVQQTVIDLLRGRARRPEGHVVADDVGVLEGGDGHGSGSGAASRSADLDAAARAAMRHRVVARLVDRPLAAAGALAVLAAADPDDPAIPADDCPVPPADDVADRSTWAGLFYAGHRDCWSDVEIDPDVTNPTSVTGPAGAGPTSVSGLTVRSRPAPRASETASGVVDPGDRALARRRRGRAVAAQLLVLDDAFEQCGLPDGPVRG